MAASRHLWWYGLRGAHEETQSGWRAPDRVHDQRRRTDSEIGLEGGLEKDQG